MKKTLKDVADIRFCLSARENIQEKHKFLTSVNLLENNVIKDFVVDNKLRADDTTKILNGDIIIKRISPSFINYIDNIGEDIYAAGNLIVIRSESINPKYLAFIISKSMRRITQFQAGIKIPAIVRSDLEEIQIPMLSENKQFLIGELWYKSIELYKLRTKLNELELIKYKSILNELTDGGNQNVR